LAIFTVVSSDVAERDQIRGTGRRGRPGIENEVAIFSTSHCVRTFHMVWVWVVLSLFVLWTLGISLMRHETTPRALWEAIIANAMFGALVFLRGL
jgi:hypothetical protein